jgi:hypothetical protein
MKQLTSAAIRKTLACAGTSALVAPYPHVQRSSAFYGKLQAHQHSDGDTSIIVAVANTGGQSKAATLVGLSQPALSAHLKRIESLVGGSIFKKAASGSIPTDLGKLVIVQAGRIIDSNDQLLRLRGDAEVSRSIRLGISDLYVETLFCKFQA